MRTADDYIPAYRRALDAIRGSGSDWNVSFIMALAAQGLRMTEVHEPIPKDFALYPHAGYPMTAPWPTEEGEPRWHPDTLLVWADPC